MIKFVMRILKSASRFVPFFGPVQKASHNIKVAAPAAVSPTGMPHLILASIVPFTFIIEGLIAAAAAAAIAVIFELVVLRPKLEAGSQEYKLASRWAIIHVMGCLAIIQTVWLLP